MKKEIEYIELQYEFDCGLNFEYRQFDGEKFVYKIDIEDVKYDIVKSEIKKLELDINPYDLIDIFDDMCLWDGLIDLDEIKYDYENDAMAWFMEENMIEECEE